ncbi:MAG: phenylacetate--CoA ligase family protein [bacterium]
MYSYLVRHLYYPITYFLKGNNVLNYLKIFEENQWKSQDELIESQKEKLFTILNYAFNNIPFYSHKYHTAKISREDIKTLKDFSKIPYLTKEEVRTFFQSLPDKSKRKIYQGHTSGSTGRPLCFYYDSNFISSTWASRWRGRGFWDVKIGDKEVAIWGRPIDSNYESWKQRFKSRLKNVLFLSAFSLSPPKLEQFWSEMIKFKPDYIYGYPSAIYQLCQFAHEKARSYHGLKAIFCTAESLYSHQKRLMAQILNSPAVNEYGCSESGGFAYECSEGNLHISTENVYVEFESNNKQVPPGELGEIIVTNLNNFYMPLIRYRVGDMGKYHKKPCLCGRGLPTMEINVAKTSDIIITHSGKKVCSHLFDYICISLLKNEEYGIQQFRIIRKSMSKYLVQIVKDTQFNQSVLDLFSKKMREFLGADIIIEYEFLKLIPRDATGKVRYYISEI